MPFLLPITPAHGALACQTRAFSRQARSVRVNCFSRGQPCLGNVTDRCDPHVRRGLCTN